MVKAGGILAIIAGLLGLLAGVATLLLGGLGAAFSANSAGLVVGMGWGGILFSLLVVVYGAVAFAAPRAASVGLALCAIGGIALSGTLVAILMVPVFVAAAMSWLGRPKPEAAAMIPRWGGTVAASIAPILAMVVIGGFKTDAAQGPPASAGTPAAELTLHIGQTARSNRFEVTVRKLRLVETIGFGAGKISASPGTVFAVLDVLVRCVDNESRIYAPGHLLIELGGKTLRFDRREAIFGLDSPSGSINPMTEKAGLVVYKIPATAANAQLNWTPGRGFDKQRFTLTTPVSPPSTPSPSSASTVDSDGNGSLTDIAGSYTGPNDGTLEIRRLGDGRLEFTLLAIAGTGSTGEADGVLTAEEGGYAYRSTEFDCQLTLRGERGNISLLQRGACGFGLNVSADGIYRKQATR